MEDEIAKRKHLRGADGTNKITCKTFTGEDGGGLDGPHPIQTTEAPSLVLSMT